MTREEAAVMVLAAAYVIAMCCWRMTIRDLRLMADNVDRLEAEVERLQKLVQETKEP